MKLAPIFLIAALALGGCVATVGTTATVSVPSDAKATCESHCERIGMPLGAVAIMANNVGCICQQPAADNSARSASTSAGMVTLVVQETERQRQQQQTHR